MDKNHYSIDLSESERTEFGRVAFADQAERQRVFSAVWALESQVNNGGFLQYFVSSDSDTAEFAPAALRTIGANTCAELVESALRAISPSPLPASQAMREKLVASVPEGIQEQMEELDQAFFAYPDDLTSLLFAYVASHPEPSDPFPRRNTRNMELQRTTTLPRCVRVCVRR
jgi:hypothetical protein